MTVIGCKIGKPKNEPNGRPQYYVSECPESKRQFLVEHGKDNNIAELTMENAEIIRRLFLPSDNKSTGHKRKSDLLEFLEEEYKRYRTEILHLHPDEPESDNDFVTFDMAKNEFLESLWDVIHQHFADNDICRHCNASDNDSPQKDKKGDCGFCEHNYRNK